jgi:hypothetical protein
MVGIAIAAPAAARNFRRVTLVLKAESFIIFISIRTPEFRQIRGRKVADDFLALVFESQLTVWASPVNSILNKM